MPAAFSCPHCKKELFVNKTVFRKNCEFCGGTTWLKELVLIYNGGRDRRTAAAFYEHFTKKRPHEVAEALILLDLGKLLPEEEAAPPTPKITNNTTEEADLVETFLQAKKREPLKKELLALLEQDDRIGAIALYREKTGAALAEAKEKIDALEANPNALLVD